MSVHKDKKRGTWYFVVRVAGKQVKRRSNKWTLKRHAAAAELEFLSNLDTEVFKNENTTIDTVCSMYLDFIKMNRKPSTITGIEYNINNHILGYFKGKSINSITSLDIEKYQKHLLQKEYLSNGESKKLSNDYLSKIQSLTRRVFMYAANHRIIPYSPFELVETAKHQVLEVKREVKILTREEFDKFIKVVDDKIQKTMYSILYWCGLRIGEALALNINDVDFETNIISITKNYDPKNQIITTTKTGNIRDVTVPNQCMKDIRDLIDYYKTFKDTPYNDGFPLLGYTRRLAKGSLDRYKGEYIKTAKVDYFTFHELRHTHVSTLIQIGARPIDIAKRTGHSVEMVNNVYGHLFKSDKTTLIDKLNNL